MKDKIKRMFTAILMTYLILVGVLYLLQRRMIFFPDTQTPDVSTYAAHNVAAVQVETADGLSVTGWRRPADAGKPTIVFFHGNAGHYGHRIYNVADFIEAGFGVVLVGYRGYGGNGGAPSEQGFYNDARAYMARLMKDGVAEKDIILYGQSIGSGVAVQMATEFPNIKR